MRILRFRFIAVISQSILFIVLSNMKAKAQLTIGVSSGFHLPRAQDQKIKHYHPNGQLEGIVYSTQVDSKSTTFSGAHATLWKQSEGKNKHLKSNIEKLEALIKQA